MAVWLQCKDRFINLDGSGEVWFSPTNCREPKQWVMHVETANGEKTIKLNEQDYQEIVSCLHLSLNPFYKIEEEI